MVFTTEGLFGVAIESWPEWDLNPWPLNFLSDALADWGIRSWVQLALRANFVQLLQFHRLFSVKFHFGCCLHQMPLLFWLKFSWGNHMSVAEWLIHMVFTTFIIHVTDKHKKYLLHSNICYLINSQYLFKFSNLFLLTISFNRRSATAVNYFRKKLHLRYLTGLWIRLCGHFSLILLICENSVNIS